MPTVDGARLMRREEFDETMAMLDRYFAYERGGMAARLPTVYDRDRPEDHAIVRADGKVVSHVAWVPETLVVGDARVDCRGVGGVATAKPYRGDGHMTDLLTFWLDRLDPETTPLAELGGNRERYGHFGFERCGQEVVFSITERSIPNRDVSGDVRVVDVGSPGAADPDVDGEDPGAVDSGIDLVRELYADHDYRIARDADRARSLLAQRGLETLIYESDDAVAYVSISRESRDRTIREFGGDPEGLEALVVHLFEWYDLNGLTVYARNDCRAADRLTGLATSWRWRPARMVRINHLPALLEALEPYLARQWRESGTARSGSLVLRIHDGDGDAEPPVRLAGEGDEFAVERTDAPPDVELDRREMTRLVFGGAGPTDQTDAAIERPILRTLFPVPFKIWGTERV